MIEHFDKSAAFWDTPDRKDRADRTFYAITKHINLNQEMTCLEYGCGTGLLSFNFYKFVQKITLVDSSQGMIEVLSKKISLNNITNMNIVLADFLDKKINVTEKFDLLYTLLTLHHIFDIYAILYEFYNILNENGFLCIADLVSEDGSFHSHLPDFSGHFGFDVNDLKRTLEYIGFRNVKYEIYDEIVRKTNDSFKNYPLFLIIAQK